MRLSPEKWVLVPLAVSLGGCTAEIGVPAPAASVELTIEAQRRARDVMAAAVVADSEEPALELRSAEWRWGDLEDAVRSAGRAGAVRFAVINARIDEDSAVFELETMAHWPAVIHVVRSPGAFPLMTSAVGPWPSEAHARRQASEIEQAVAVALRAWGRKPALPTN